jgi:hypothetical protein
MLVPPGHIAKTMIIPVETAMLASKDRIAVGDVDRAYQKRLQIGSNHPWPCPIGYWQGNRFLIVDGRHEWIATIMLGHETILVAWIESMPGGEP